MTSQSTRIEIVETPERLAAIGPAWSALWRANDALVFQSHAWVSAWWNTLPRHHGYRLRIGLLWAGDRLLAVLPLVVARRKGLRFLEWAAISCTDYPDVLAAPDCPPETLARLWLALCKRRGVDLIQLARLLPGARVRSMLAASTTHGPTMRPGHRAEISYRVSGDYSGEGGWFARQSGNTRQTYRRRRKQLEQDAQSVRFRLVDPATEPLAPILARFNELKRKWLVATGRQSELLETHSGAVEALVGVLSDLGVLRLFVLERDAQIVAMTINFEQRGALMVFLPAYDLGFERASPGSMLTMDYIQWSAEHGLDMVDFLCGEDAYKLRYADEAVVLETLVAPRSVLGHAALLANRLRLAIRRRQTAASGHDEPPGGQPPLPLKRPAAAQTKVAQRAG